jgi:ribosome-binding ATPase
MMSLSVGIVGLPNAGKSTLFNALARRQLAQTGKHPFTTVEPNRGTVEVPDEILSQLARLTPGDSLRKTPVKLAFVDIAGLIKGAHKGEGLGNQFLHQIREVDVILHVVRAFEDDSITHIHGDIDPEFDLEVVREELALGRIKKPEVVVRNVGEAESNSVFDISVLKRGDVKRRSVQHLSICARLEEELAGMVWAERRQYLKEFKLPESALDRVIRACYRKLKLITFYTIAGGKEARSQGIRKGSSAYEAAGKIHTDIQKGFIKTEVINAKRLLEIESWQKAADKGEVKLHGRDYVVKDGDVLEIKFKTW